MTTEKKAESNRKNAQKSTGQRSAAGKAIVSQNARTHGLLSRSLIVKGESQEELSELLRLLSEDFQPVGLVECALVERIAIALWRQRRLVRAESAEVAINQQRFGSQQAEEVGAILKLGFDVYRHIEAPEEETKAVDLSILKDRKNLWQSIADSGIADENEPFTHLPQNLQKSLLESFSVEANEINALVKANFGSWGEMIKAQVRHFEFLIKERRIPEVSRLLMMSHALPSKTDLLARYQTALDNDLYKALKALREAQAWRHSKAVISMTPVLPSENGGTQ